MRDILIGGVPILALSHRDGRFMRLAGLFAFAKREASGIHQVLHSETTEAIDRDAGPNHPRWAWALGAGMNTLLVHCFGQPAPLPEQAPLDWETVTWQPDAQVRFLDDADAREHEGVAVGATQSSTDYLVVAVGWVRLLGCARGDLFSTFLRLIVSDGNVGNRLSLK